MPSFHPGYTVAGVLVLAFVLHDVIATTLHRGGGPITRLLIGPLWRLAIRTHHRGIGTHRLMSRAGLTLVVVTICSWIGLTWVGWTLVFSGERGAIIHAESALPASLLERAYFVGFTVSTLGIGDYVPAAETLWQPAASLAALCGFMLVTFALAYLIPVVENAVAKRAFASQLSALGDTPSEMLLGCCSGRDLTRMASTMEWALEKVALLRQAYFAYPVLHFFHEPRADESVAVALVRFDEAIRIARLGLEESHIDDGLCAQWRILVRRFAETITSRSRDPGSLPAPNLTPLRQASFRVVSDRDYAARVEAEREDRARLAELLRGHGWGWAQVFGGPETEDAEADPRAAGVADAPR